MAEWSEKLKGFFTPYALIAADKATAKAEATYPPNEQHNARGDAYRHLVWQALVARNKSPTQAKIVGNLNEIGWNNPSEEKAMDKFNNQLGIRIASQAKTEADIYRLAKEYVDKGIAKYIPVEELEYRAMINEARNMESDPAYQ